MQSFIFRREKITQWYRVDDMFDFDNVGFSKTVDDCKFLTCADCEIGPIGYQGHNSIKCQQNFPQRLSHYRNTSFQK